MRCPSCATLEDKVVDSRQSDDGTAIRRRRECLACGARFTTFERLEVVPLVVVKRSGERMPFDRERIVQGIAASGPVCMQARARDVVEADGLCIVGTGDTSVIVHYCRVSP